MGVLKKWNEEMLVLLLYLCNNQSTTHRCCTVIIHQVTRIINDVATTALNSLEQLRTWNDSLMNVTELRVTVSSDKDFFKLNHSGAPHGIWEKLVLSCKKVMSSIVVSRWLNDEIISTTILLSNEYSVNVTEKISACKPNHFLLRQKKQDLFSCQPLKSTKFWGNLS